MDTSDTDELAKATFRAQLSPSFITVFEAPDKQHLDYTAHHRADGEPQGLQFGIQLKGTAAPRVSNGCIRHPVAKKHLRYWIEKSRIPVFLVVVDDVKKEAFFCSIHEWDVATASRWRKQKKPSVSIPFANRLADSDALLAAVRSAWSRLEELHPGSIAAAARQESERLTQMDPRFRYAFSVDEDGGQLVTLHARENVQAKFEIRGARAFDKWNEMLRTGRPAEFVPGEEIRFEEAGIFGEIQRQAAGRPIAWQATSKNVCDIALLARTRDGAERDLLAGFRGDLVGGTDERRFEARHPFAPISVCGSLKFVEEGAGFRTAGSFTIRLDHRAWAGTRLLDLRAFPLIEQFLEVLRGAESLLVRLTIDCFLALTGQLPAVEVIDRVGAPARFIARLRNAAQKLGVNPLYDPSSSDLDAASDLCDLVEKGDVVLRLQPGDLTADVDVDLSQPEARDRILAAAPMTVEVVDPLVFLGEDSPSWRVRTTLTGVRPTEVSQAAIAALHPRALSARCFFESVAGATLRRRLAPRD